MKKLLACLFMVMALQTAAFADAETDMHQMYISKSRHKMSNTVLTAFLMLSAAEMFSLLICF